MLAGFGITPTALATAPIATQAKIADGGDSCGAPRSSPSARRTSCAPASRCRQSSSVIGRLGGQERHQEGRHAGRRLRRPASTPRRSSERSSSSTAARSLDELRSPLRSPDFAPFLQQVRDAASPTRVFVFLPSGQGAAFMKQFVERGLDKAGIKLIAHRRRHRRRPAQRHGRRRARRRQLAPLLGGASVGRRTRSSSPTFKAANKFAPQLHGGRRLRRHARDLRGAEEDQRQDRRRALLARDEGQMFESPRGPMLDRRARRATSCRTSTSARSRRRRRALQRRVPDVPRR